MTEPEIIQDERQGLSSASSFARLYACPGSAAAERGLSELPKDDTTDEGTQIHDALHTGDDSGLALTPKQIKQNLEAMELRARENWAAEFNITDMLVVRETRFWLRNPTTLELIASAKPDVVCISGKRASTTDFKSGFADTTPSERNMQLRVQSIAIFQEFNVEHVRAAIAHSRLSSHFDSVDFELEDLRRVEKEIVHTVWRSEQSDAPRIPGAHCRYCRANGACFEKAVYDQIASAHLPVIATGKKGDELTMIEAVNRLTPEQLAFLHRRKPSLEVAYLAIEHRLKSLPEDVLQSIGYELAKGNRIREITDAATAFARLAPLMKHDKGDDRLAGLKLVIGKMSEALADRTGVSLESAKNQIYSALGDVVLEREGNKRLRPI